jgi:hypothetical protein
LFSLDRIVEIQGIGLDQTVVQRMGQLRQRHELYLLLYIKGQVQPVEQLYPRLLFDLFDQAN